MQDKIQQREAVYDQLMKTSEQFLESTEPEDERKELKSKIDDLTNRWETVTEKMTESLAGIDEVSIGSIVYRGRMVWKRKRSHCVMFLCEDM